MVSLSRKKRDVAKLDKRYLTLGEKIKVLDVVKKRNMSNVVYKLLQLLHSKLWCRVTAKRVNSGAGHSMEIPLTYTFTGHEKAIELEGKIRQDLYFGGKMCPLLGACANCLAAFRRVNCKSVTGDVPRKTNLSVF